MSDLSFLAIPNVAGMHMRWYIQIFFVALLFGISLFLLLYVWVLYRRNRSLVRKLAVFDQKTQELSQQLMQSKIIKASGKEKLVLFIAYLEKFITTKATDPGPVRTYANLSDLLHAQGFTSAQIASCEQVLYSGRALPKDIAHHIDIFFTS